MSPFISKLDICVLLSAGLVLTCSTSLFDTILLFFIFNVLKLLPVDDSLCKVTILLSTSMPLTSMPLTS